jgi:hypothetical protein
MSFGDELSGESFRGGLNDLAIGMKQQQPKQFTTSIAGAADDPDPDHEAFSRA